MARYKTYLPSINAGPTVPPGAPGGTADPARTVFDLMRKHPQQGRPRIVWSDLLAKVARARARDMATRNYFSHTNPDGYGPNYLVRQARYNLPDWYANELDANNIESINRVEVFNPTPDTVASAGAQAMWKRWLTSPDHRRHVLAEIDFYRDQVNVGIAFWVAHGNPVRFYWCLLSAPES